MLTVNTVDSVMNVLSPHKIVDIYRCRACNSIRNFSVYFVHQFDYE